MNEPIDRSSMALDNMIESIMCTVLHDTNENRSEWRNTDTHFPPSHRSSDTLNTSEGQLAACWKNSNNTLEDVVQTVQSDASVDTPYLTPTQGNNKYPNVSSKS